MESARGRISVIHARSPHLWGRHDGGYPCAGGLAQQQMPLYEFKCSQCGGFDQWRSMAESSYPAHCPTCQALATRLISAPMLLNSPLRLSQKANPEPQLVQRTSQDSAKPTLHSHAQGRPWMISH